MQILTIFKKICNAIESDLKQLLIYFISCFIRFQISSAPIVFRQILGTSELCRRRFENKVIKRIGQLGLLSCKVG